MLSMQTLVAASATNVSLLLPMSNDEKEKSESIIDVVERVLNDIKADHINVSVIDINGSEKDVLSDLKSSSPDVVVSSSLEGMVTEDGILRYLEANQICALFFDSKLRLSQKNACFFALAPMIEDNLKASAKFASDDGYEINVLLEKDSNINTKILQALEADRKINLSYVQFYDASKISDDWYLADFFAGIMSKAANKKQAILINDDKVIQYLKDFQRYNNNILIILPHNSQIINVAKEYDLENVVFSSLNKDIDIKSIAYDGISIINYIKNQASNKKLNKQDFLLRNGFCGITGAIRFLPDGSNQRLFEISGFNTIIRPAKKIF